MSTQFNPNKRTMVKFKFLISNKVFLDKCGDGVLMVIQYSMSLKKSFGDIIPDHRRSMVKCTILHWLLWLPECAASHWKLACPGWMHWLSRSGVAAWGQTYRDCMQVNILNMSTISGGCHYPVSWQEETLEGSAAAFARSLERDLWWMFGESKG